MWEKTKIIFSWIWKFILPYVRLMLTEYGPVLMSAAMKAVAATRDGMTGANSDQMRNAAYALIVQDLKQQGIRVGLQVGESLIKTTLEIALQKLKEESHA